VSDENQPQPPSAAVKPWGRWSTFGLGVVALLIGQIAALVVLTWWYGLGLARLPDFSGDGAAVSLVIYVSTPVQLALLWVMARQTGAEPAGYLGLIMPKKGDVVVGLLAIAAFIVVGDTVSWLIGQNIVTSFQSDIFRTAASQGWLPVLLFAVVVVTPIGEETLFRGFLFRGWHRTPRDAWIVIVVTAALWAFVHVQYDLYVIGQVFVCGLMLGWFRWATGSTLLTILLHGVVNFEGMLETFLSLHG
jgi:membrane protease YdiL (CAAX protease family)